MSVLGLLLFSFYGTAVVIFLHTKQFEIRWIFSLHFFCPKGVIICTSYRHLFFYFLHDFVFSENNRIEKPLDRFSILLLFGQIRKSSNYRKFLLPFCIFDT